MFNIAEEKFKAAMPTCKRSAVKRNTSTRRQAATSRAAQADLFTSKSSLEFGEDVKKRLRLLSEVVLRTVKRRLAATFAIFLAKKMAEREGFEPSVILLVKSRLKRCFIPPFERKFLKF